MFRPAIAPAFRRPNPSPLRLRPRRDPLIRRDPRRFARGTAKLHAPMVAAARSGWADSSDLRLFAHTFGAAFLFVSVFIA